MKIDTNADMRSVYERLAAKRHGTYGELADMIRVFGRRTYPPLTFSGIAGNTAGTPAQEK